MQTGYFEAAGEDVQQASLGMRVFDEKVRSPEAPHDDRKGGERIVHAGEIGGQGATLMRTEGWRIRAQKPGDLGDVEAAIGVAQG